VTDYVLDACVAIAAAQVREPTHAEARELVARLLSGQDRVVVPALFQVEVASGLARAGWEPARVAAWVDALLQHARVVTVGPRAAAKIQRVAMSTRLRAGDAAYVWLACREGVTLITSDDEVLVRAASVCACSRP